MLYDELAQLKKLESKLDALDFRSEDKDTIVERMIPLFDTLLLERLKDKDERTVKIFSDYLTQIITKTSSSNPEALSYSLQKVIAPAISKEIANNKDVMIDSLYPIMGGMISKYVSQAIKEMLETINEKIEDGLSFDKYKRKLKSKITGVSETELLLEESSDVSISSLFIIQKESGLLIANAYLKDKEIDDPHMVASMASAIKDFINDWVQSHTSKNEVQILSYGSATLYIESAGSIYIIAFLDSEPDHELRLKINHFFASLVKKYATFFQNFDGDDSAIEIQSLSKNMHEFLDINKAKSTLNNVDDKISPMKYLMIFVGMGFFITSMFYLDIKYKEYIIESSVKEKAGYVIDVEMKNDSIILNGIVNKLEDSNIIEEILARHTKKPMVNKLTIPSSNLARMLQHEREKRESEVLLLNKRLQEILNNRGQ